MTQRITASRSYPVFYPSKNGTPVAYAHLQIQTRDSIDIKTQCIKSIYPFHDGECKDLAPPFDLPIKVSATFVEGQT